jgi:hypothetical protein
MNMRATSGRVHRVKADWTETDKHEWLDPVVIFEYACGLYMVENAFLRKTARTSKPVTCKNCLRAING